MPMSLMLLVELHALASTNVWLAGERPPATQPDTTVVSAGDLTTSQGWTEADDRAIAFLAEELSAVRPLADVFDGELQIMVRLSTAIEQVRAVRESDRELLYKALVYQGFAVQRYFQDKLETDPGAAAYVTRQEGRAEVTAWLEAVALNPERVPTASEIPDQSALLAFQELRARHLLSPTCAITVSNMPRGGRLVVDGREAATDQTRVLPGRHLVAVTVNGEIRARAELTLAPGGTGAIVVPAGPDELGALAASLADGPPSIKLSPSVQGTLQSLEPPVLLTVTGRRGDLTYAVKGAAAERVESAGPSGSGDPSLVLHTALGGGWLYDGEFLLQNYDEGATATRSTVNAATPVASLGVEYRPVRALALGLGVDLAVPLGEFQYLPTGDDQLRLRPYPHVAIGHPYLQLTAGPLLPWRIGVGGRLHVPLGEHVEVQGAYIYGLGLEIPRDAGAEFEASDAAMAWVGAGWRWQGRDH